MCRNRGREGSGIDDEEYADVGGGADRSFNINAGPRT